MTTRTIPLHVARRRLERASPGQINLAIIRLRDALHAKLKAEIKAAKKETTS